MIPASFRGWAGTMGVLSSILGRNLPAFLLMPPLDGDQPGPQHLLSQLEIGLKPVGILLPRRLIVPADRLGRPVLGLFAVQRKVSQLAAGYGRPVGQRGAADPVGLTVPMVVRDGIFGTASHLDRSGHVDALQNLADCLQRGQGGC